MKKIKEISLAPDYGVTGMPLQKRYSSHNGGPMSSADSTYSRTVMQRVNKGFEEEVSEEEEDLIKELELELNSISGKALINEFSLGSLENLGSLTKSAVASIPVFGDAFSFIKFMWTVTLMRRQVRKFTKTFSDLSEVDLGRDIFEPEGSIASDGQLNAQLSEAVGRLEQLNAHPELNVTMRDIKKLKSQYMLLCKYVKDALQEFIGFADFAFGQKGFFLNAAISYLAYSEIPDFITGEYSEFIADMTKRARSKNTTVIDKLGSVAYSFISGPAKMLDFFGHMDILLNPEKLSRLGMIHDMFGKFSHIDTNEEKAEMGLDAIPGTPFDAWLESNYMNYNLDAYKKYADLKNSKISLSSAFKDSPNIQGAVDSLINEISGVAFYEKPSLSELYEEDSEEEDPVEEASGSGGGGGMGFGLPLGMSAKGSAKKGGEPSIYTAANMRKFQNFASKTLGNKK